LKEIIKIIAEVVNEAHDLLLDLTNLMGWNLTDKDLHLWVIGILGILIFMGVQVVFKMLAEWSITAISFIYTFTVHKVIQKFNVHFCFCQKRHPRRNLGCKGAAQPG